MLQAIILLLVSLSPIYCNYQSYLTQSPLGLEYLPRNPVQLLMQITAQNQISCVALCNLQPSCRTIDFDLTSRRCRLFEGDLTTGSVVPSTSPTSVVGLVIISPALFVQGQPHTCQACRESRYEMCASNRSTCQCRPHTFWNNSTCVLQQLENSTCSQIDGCRADLNLTCVKDFNGQFKRCSSGQFRCC
jgi:hypothetical protein